MHKNQLAFLLWGVAWLAHGSQANVWIAQNSAGADSGIDAANAHSAAWFNTAGNWGNDATDIGPGTVVHLVGTFTASAGQSALSVQGSGTLGSLITIQAESGCLFSATRWGGTTAGAINVSTARFIVLDGQGYGTITNTDNGTGLSQAGATSGIYFSSCTNVTITRWTIVDMYKNLGHLSGATDAAGVNSAGIVGDAPYADITISSNITTSSRVGISCRYDTAGIDNVDVSYNSTSNHAWHIQSGGWAANAAATHCKFHHNQSTGWTQWQYPSATYHTDGIIVWAPSNGHLYTPEVYANYLYGNLGNGSPTAFIFLTYDGTSSAATNNGIVYNNLCVATAARAALWTQAQCVGARFFNNTLIGPGSTGTAIMQQGVGNFFSNNIVYGWSRIMGCYHTCTNEVAGMDNNLYYAIASGTPFGEDDGARFYSLTQWRAFGFDVASVTADPLLNADYTIQQESPAIGAGFALSSLFSTDKAGITRGANWAIGAYEYVPSGPVTLRANTMTVRGTVSTR